MAEKTIYIAIGLMALVTWIPRVVPLVAFSRKSYPTWFKDWLKFVPVTVLSALLAPELFLKNKEFFVSFDNLYLVASIPTFVVAIFTRNMFITLFAGMGLLAALRFYGF